MGDGERVFQVFSNIEISNFSDSVVEKDVRWFDVSVNDVSFVQLEKTFQAVVSDVPNIALWDSAFHGDGFFNLTL